MIRLYVTLASFASTARERMDRSQRGAAAVEYGMLVALIAAVCVTTVALLGPKIAKAFNDIVTALTNAGVEQERPLAKPGSTLPGGGADQTARPPPHQR